MITTDKGAVKQCIRNVVTVLQNDPKFKGVIRYNMMTDRNDIVKDLGWYRESPVLTDSDIDHIMLYLEENYSLTTEKKIKSAINVVAMENKYHPIQEKLNSLVWDKKERIKDVLYHFLGADRNVYTYEAMKVLLLGAISRVFRPGTKFEYMLILVGGQGAGKSTFFRFLAMNDSWFTDDLKKLDDENVFRRMILAFLDDFKGDRVCSKLLWKEALHRDYEPKRIELKQICDIMNNSVTDWVMSDGAMHFGDYGKQRGWVRVGSSQEIPDKADSDGFMEIPKQLELEIPFK